MSTGFRLFKRKTSKKPVYYARILDSRGNIVITVSTGETNQYRAHDWAKEYVEKLNAKSPDLTLKEYAAEFYVWEKCDWIARQNAKGRSVVETTARGRRADLENYLFPQFGDTLLKDITAPAVEKYLLRLCSYRKVQGKKKPLANSTKNQIIYTLNIILKEAKRERLIQAVPEFEPFGTKRTKHRQPLTDAEINQLFPQNQNKFIEIWGSFEIGVLFETILSTGARSGEARGWWKSDVLVDAKAMKIFRQIYEDGTYGLPGRKRNPDKDPRRIVLLPDRTIEDIIKLIGNPPYPDELLFTFDAKPFARSYLLDLIKKAAKKAKIDQNIDVHTLRYTYTSKMRELMISADIPDFVLQKLLGHSKPQITDIYDPFQLDRAVKKALPSRPAIDNFWNTKPVQV